MFTYIPIHDEHLMKHGPCIVEISMSQKIGIKINNNNNNNNKERKFGQKQEVICHGMADHLITRHTCGQV